MKGKKVEKKGKEEGKRGKDKAEEEKTERSGLRALKK